MLFIVLNVDDEDVQRILALVDDTADRDTLPLIYFVQSQGDAGASTQGVVPQRKYRLDASDVTAPIIAQFIRDVLDGKIKVGCPLRPRAHCLCQSSYVLTRGLS